MAAAHIRPTLLAHPPFMQRASPSSSSAVRRYRCFQCGFNAVSFGEMAAHAAHCSLTPANPEEVLSPAHPKRRKASEQEERRDCVTSLPRALAPSLPSETETRSSFLPQNFISKTDARAVNAAPFTENTTGLRLSKVIEFIEKRGGREAFEDLSTFEVVETHIKPMTNFSSASGELKDVSCAEFLYHSAKEEERSSVGEAVLFISHAWSYNFLEVVDAIDLFIKKDGALGADPIIWFDIFCVSQHLAGVTDTAWFLDTFMAAVQKMKRVLQILSPYDDPLPIHRGWCVFEVFSCLATSSQFSVTFPETQLALFIEAVLDDWTFLRKMFAKLQTADCECGRAGETDAAKIGENEANISAIRQAVHEQGLTFNDLDRLVLGALQEAVVEVLSRLAAEEEDMVRKGRLLRSLGVVYKDVGKFEKALAVLEEAVPVLTAAEGREGDNTLRALSSLAAVYGKLQRFDEQLDVHSEVLATCIARCGELDESTLLVRSNVATTLANMGRFGEALREHEKILEAKKQLLGEAHEDTLRSMNEVGVSLIDVGESLRAVEVLERCRGLRLKVLGKYHRDTADTFFWLGKAYFELGRLRQGELDLQECVEARRRALNESHPLVRQANGLLEVLRDRIRAAEEDEEDEEDEDEDEEEEE